MSDYLNEFKPPQRTLLGAGPCMVHSRVLHAMAEPILGHQDPVFLEILGDVSEMLRVVFQTSNPLTLAVSGTGTAGVEAAMCNMLERGDVVILAENGHFAHRAADTASRCGADVRMVPFPWGGPVGPDLSPLEDELKKHKKVKAVSIVHGETSTGARSPLPEIADLVHRYDSVLIVDAVASLGGVEMKMDEWDIDLCHSGTQKCLGAPSGLAPISVGPRAAKVLRERQTPVQSFYLNLVDLETYWGEQHRYHHTAPISMIYAIREALRMAMEEGMENRIQRHAQAAEALRAGLEALGLELFAHPDYRLNPLTSVIIPEGLDEARMRRKLLLEHNVEVSGGIGQLAGKIWRIGLMGHSAHVSNVLVFLSALEQVLAEEGYEVARGSGVAGAQRSLA